MLVTLCAENSASHLASSALSGTRRFESSGRDYARISAWRSPPLM